MGALKAIAESATRITDAGGLQWKIRRVCSRDLAVWGHGQLFALLNADDVNAVLGAAKSGAAPDFGALAATLVERLRSMPDPARVRMANAQDAMVCSGVVAVRDPAAEPPAWESVTISGRKLSSPDEGVLNISDLPDGIRRTLAAAVQEHSGAEEGLADALASFRAGAAIDG